MKIVALRERTKGEYRAAITPETAGLLHKKGYKVFVERNIGLAANFSDIEYARAGAKVSAIPLEILSDADIVLKVQPSPLVDEYNEIDMTKKGAIIIGLLSPHLRLDYIKKSLEKGLSTISMELVPRITKAQNMDVLSSQSNLAGYRAVIEAGYYFDRAFPMMMTAAGTISAAKTLVLGVGVAGLQAIATAKRLGSIVSAYDVRLATKEQVESLGAKFVYPTISGDDAEDNKGYAKEVSKDFASIQENFLSEIIDKFDIVITTAQIPGKKAPILLTKSVVAKMRSGSVIVDMATSSGGNVEDSLEDKVIVKKGVKFIGWSNLSSRIAHDSSKLYAKNLYNFLNYAIKDQKINFKDSLVEEMIIGLNGQMVNKKFKV
jgi:H+-translocating NAD(P) transhydrogenase subunit alpha